MNHSPIKIESYVCYLASDPDLFQWECECGEEGDNHDTFADALGSINAHIETANNYEVNAVAAKLIGIAKGHVVTTPAYDWDAVAKHVIEKGYKL